ncbi:hypothetical protein BDV95DRAFT_659126 [Massariosphaeria phaeospora]|uniref:Rhodopsin domain-containing protein n=1 Tax=Massariosphaeria phaeospora TaxID=100035 RepID=A0A7C8IAA8_9PLEO|nr:hypothetical protein BDV95DRAFT_659126 [Massariosphaeria phaeospora]
MWDVSLAHIMSERFIQIGFHTNWVPAIVWGFAKTTFFLMYLDLFGPLIWLRWACYIGIFANWSLYLGKLVANIYMMTPSPGQTWLEASQTPRYVKSFDMAIPIAVCGLILDVYIFILPLIVLSNLQITKPKKLGLIAIFGTGFLACIASTLSLVFNEKVKKNAADYTYWVYPALLMALAEMCIGITCSCMPSLVGFLKKSNSSSKIWTWGSRLFSSHNRYGRSSHDNNKQFRPVQVPGHTRAKTYLNIETESNNAFELTNTHSSLATKG